MRTILLIIALGIVGCVAPDRTYNVFIHNQGNGNTVQITVKADAPQDYDVAANVDVTARTIP